MIYDYIIIGQGLAGSCMALQLISRGRKVLVIDQPHANSSSMVAAGLFNPITGRKMVKTWKADLLFPYLIDFYKKWEKNLSASFIHERGIYRPFWDMEEQNEWMGKSTGSQYKDYIAEVSCETQYPDDLYDEYGGLLLKQCGFVDLPSFIQSVRKYLIAQDAYIEERVDFSDIKIGKIATLKDWSANRLIFCSGQEAVRQAYFDWLPHKPVKGEVLEIEVDDDPELIYNRGVFVMPRDKGKCRVGATYDQSEINFSITEKGKKTLEEKLQKVYRKSYNISNQVAGVRPATKDRRPFVGIHPEYEQIGIFNGLGAKGVSLAPYFSEQFVSHLEEGQSLDSEIDINRYKSLYYEAQV